MQQVERPWDKNLQLLLVAIVAVNAAPFILEIPVWTTLITACFLTWKILYLIRGVARPQRAVVWLISFASSIGIFITYGTILGQEAASALLVILASTKVLETNRYRDAMIVIFTSYFLLMAHLLNSQSLLTTIFMAVDVMLITALMFQAHRRDRRTSVRAFRPVMKLLGLAIPVWILLFVAFPRFSTGIMNAQTSRKVESGFSDQLDPGGVEKLADSDEPAFRVTFQTQPPPPPEYLYWRGAVLTKSEGLRWSRPKADSHLNSAPHQSRERPSSYWNYLISLEPIYHKWVFVLDYPVSITPDEKFSQLGVEPLYGDIYDTKKETVSRAYYEASSTLQSADDEMTADERSELLQLPEILDPKILKLAGEFKRAAVEKVGGGPPAMADRVSDEILEWFTREDFRYTKEPGPLAGKTGPEQLEQFLFISKKGFCEHFAAAFATLARAAGVPARITVGFQGGQTNDVGGYLVVRSLDAHAWAEVWRESTDRPGHGRWTRVDPTSVIAPLRLKLGGDYNRLDGSTRGLSLEEAERRLTGGLEKIRLRLEFAWDAGQSKWNAFLNDYDFEFQKTILSKLGLEFASRWLLSTILLIGVMGLLGSLSWWLKRRSKREDPLVTSWRELGRKLEKAGLEPRDFTEGPLSFAQRAKSKWPAEQEKLDHLVSEFCELRYGLEENANTRRRRAFARSVRRFKIDP